MGRIRGIAMLPQVKLSGATMFGNSTASGSVASHGYILTEAGKAITTENGKPIKLEA